VHCPNPAQLFCRRSTSEDRSCRFLSLFLCVHLIPSSSSFFLLLLLLNFPSLFLLFCFDSILFNFLFPLLHFCRLFPDFPTPFFCSPPSILTYYFSRRRVHFFLPNVTTFLPYWTSPRVLLVNVHRPLDKYGHGSTPSSCVFYPVWQQHGRHCTYRIAVK
jgi:hypothetical protein